MRRLIGFALLFLTCVACRKETMWVQSESVLRSSLASHRIRTPDPRRICPDVGQRLIVHWCLPRNTCMEGYFLALIMRFGSREERTVCVPLHQPRGCYVYSVLNDEYFDRCGIHGFKAELLCDGKLEAEWVHQVWADLIEIAIADEPSWQHREDSEDQLPSFENLSY